jgi:hypothetical protein
VHCSTSQFCDEKVSSEGLMLWGGVAVCEAYCVLAALTYNFGLCSPLFALGPLFLMPADCVTALCRTPAGRGNTRTRALATPSTSTSCPPTRTPAWASCPTPCR